MSFIIKPGSIEEVVALSKLMPEFDHPHEVEEYIKRLAGKKQLILVAYTDGKPVAFKVGYEKEADGSFYSWMGGVLPAYRKEGIAKSLASIQEKWASENGYKHIRFKTRNRHQAMLLFAIKNGFQIIGVEPRETLAEYRILLEKKI
ncbi:GNAT family N-acetyltransferase [Rhodocytophaga aerolata]|uniref:GNAT family N-acetyltransferase n=1 Tax=Rhodocytophaga aerolata TaxID=455078 RepID=A0ABT8RBT8_9BACT|nr:GNAT family N-acetyltransferase [Rhodocytophaga aerolata]MDO1449156.1 GNAT family N-acetyltransferase [Rhodocytophaga aerolata]